MQRQTKTNFIARVHKYILVVKVLNKQMKTQLFRNTQDEWSRLKATFSSRLLTELTSSSAAGQQTST